MILNSYSLQKAILMNKRRQQYNDMKTIIPKNNIYTSLTSTIIQKSEYVEEIKNVVTKKKNKKSPVLDLNDLDDIELPDLKEEEDEIVIVKKEDEGEDEDEDEGEDEDEDEDDEDKGEDDDDEESHDSQRSDDR